jgi:dihydroorotate dehydrogenase electron transfer subunit
VPSPDVTDLLVAGGVGLPPLFMQAEGAARFGLANGSEMLYGGRTSRDLVLLGEMRGLGIALHLATEDGSLGRRGRVTDELEARLDHWRAAASTRRLRIMACGPRAMLWAVGRIAQSCGIECYLSLEEQMACGIGVCLGCAVAAQTRPYRYVCKDGPVFPAAEVMADATSASTGPSEGGAR